MAERNPPSWTQAGSHPSEHDRLMGRALLSAATGVNSGVLADTGLAVTANGTPNMSVNVAAGSLFVEGTESGFQGTYHCYNDAVVNLVVGASDPTNPRIDLVIARVRDASYSGALSTFALEIVQGTAAGTPLVPATPASSLVLAQIAVGAGVSTIVAGNITERRTFVGGWTAFTPTWASTGSSPSIGNGTLWGRYRKFGKKLDVRYSMLTGTTTVYGAAAWYFLMPSTFVTANAGLQILPAYYSIASNYHGVLTIEPGQTALIMLVDAGTAGGAMQFPTSTVPATWVSGARIVAQGTLEIQ